MTEDETYNAELLREAELTPGPVPGDAITTALHLKTHYAFCRDRAKTPVVSLHATSVEDGCTLANFRTSMLPYSEIEVGPRGGERRINPADVWLAHPQRVAAEGLQMRPDKPRPTFREDGGLWINTYYPPAHDATGGDASLGIGLLQQLIPDAEERSYFWQLLAHKFRHPSVPGPAWVMVAHDAFGTGRGTFIALIKRLFGMRYVVEVPFHLLSGSSYQSQYNDWQAEGVIAYVEEAQETGGNSKWAVKSDAYERLKAATEVRPGKRRIVNKGIKSGEQWVFATYLICTNHIDAFPIPENDRRFAVFTNGQPREKEYWERVNAWMEDDANIAAFAKHLLKVDLTGFSPYEVPPQFTGKSRMSDAAKSDLDKGMAQALHHLTGELLAASQVINAMREIAEVYDYRYPDRWEEIAKKVFYRNHFRIGERGGRNWEFSFIRQVPQQVSSLAGLQGRSKGGGMRMPVYARTERARKKWTLAEPEEVRRELLRNGDPSTLVVPGDVANGLRVFDVGADVEERG